MENRQGRLVGRIRAVEGCVKVGGTVKNTLKGGRTEKKGGETKFQKGGKLGQGVGALQTMELKSLFYNQLAKLACQMIEMYYEYFSIWCIRCVF